MAAAVPVPPATTRVSIGVSWSVIVASATSPRPDEVRISARLSTAP